jgi:hypothetical protein
MNIGEVVRQRLLLFSKGIPIPAVNLVSAIAAAVLSKTLEVHQKRVSEALSQEIRLQHISYVQPDNKELLNFYNKNPIIPELAKEFEKEIKQKGWKSLRKYYPYLYSALVLKLEIPTLLFHQEIEQGEFRKMAIQYEQLARGYAAIEGKPALHRKINRFARQLLEVILEAYDTARKELPRNKNAIAYEILDLIREIASS